LGGILVGGLFKVNLKLTYVPTFETKLFVYFCILMLT
jgi:hypothetical protein